MFLINIRELYKRCKYYLQFMITTTKNINGLPQENESQHLGEVSVPSVEVGGHHPAVLEAGLGDPHLKIRGITATISLILFTNKIFMSCDVFTW